MTPKASDEKTEGQKHAEVVRREAENFQRLFYEDGYLSAGESAKELLAAAAYLDGIATLDRQLSDSNTNRETLRHWNEKQREDIATLTAEAAELKAAVGNRSPSLVAKLIEQAKQGADLFCWCVENLEKFPPREGAWHDDIKRRLTEASELRAEVERLREELEGEKTSHLGTLRMADAANTHSVEIVEWAVDHFIQALLRHKRDVWPDAR